MPSCGSLFGDIIWNFVFPLITYASGWKFWVLLKRKSSSIVSDHHFCSNYLIYFQWSKYHSFVRFPISFFHSHYLKTFILIIFIIFLFWMSYESLSSLSSTDITALSVISNSTLSNPLPSKWNVSFAMLAPSHPSPCHLFPFSACSPFIWVCYLLMRFLSYLTGPHLFFTCYWVHPVFLFSFLPGSFHTCRAALPLVLQIISLPFIL